MKKRVLVVSPTLEGGGVSTVVNNISKELIKYNVICDYICFVKPSEVVEKKFLEMGSEIFLIKRFSESGLFKHINDIRKIIRKKQYQAVHAHTNLLIWISCLAAKKEGIEIRIGHAHGMKFLNYPEIILKLIETPFRFFNRFYCTEMVTCSEKSGMYTFGQKVKYIPNFIDFQDCQIESEKKLRAIHEELNISSNSIVMGYVGSLDGVKNTKYLVNVLDEINKIRDVVLVLVGDGSSMEELKRDFFEKNLDKKVIFLGHRSDVNYLMNIFDFYITSSLSEGMSMSIIQAQMCKKPCLVSRGVPDVNDIDLGLFYQCNTFDVKEWCNKIQEIISTNIDLTDKDILEALYRKKIDKDTAISELINIYNI